MLTGHSFSFLLDLAGAKTVTKLSHNLGTIEQQKRKKGLRASCKETCQKIIM